MKFVSQLQNGAVFQYRGMRQAARLQTGETSMEVPTSVYFTVQFQKDLKEGRVKEILTATDRAFIMHASQTSAALAADRTPPVTSDKARDDEIFAKNMTADKTKEAAINVVKEELELELGMIQTKRGQLDFLNGVKVRLGGHKYSNEIIEGLMDKYELRNLDAEDEVGVDPEREDEPEDEQTEEPGVKDVETKDAGNDKGDGNEDGNAEDTPLVTAAKAAKKTLKPKSPKSKMMRLALALGVAGADISMKQAKLYGLLKERIAEILA